MTTILDLTGVRIAKIDYMAGDTSGPRVKAEKQYSIITRGSIDMSINGGPETTKTLGFMSGGQATGSTYVSTALENNTQIFIIRPDSTTYPNYDHSYIELTTGQSQPLSVTNISQLFVCTGQVTVTGPGGPFVVTAEQTIQMTGGQSYTVTADQDSVATHFWLI